MFHCPFLSTSNALTSKSAMEMMRLDLPPLSSNSLVPWSHSLSLSKTMETRFPKSSWSTFRTTRVTR